MVKNIIIAILAILVIWLSFFSKCEKTNCPAPQETITPLTDTTIVVDTVFQEVATDSTENPFLTEIEALKSLIDSLEQPQTTPTASYTQSEVQVRSSVDSIIQALNTITDTKDVNAYLSHFNPKFTTNIVNIGVDNQVYVERQSPKAYRKRIEDMLSIPGLKFIMKDPVHLKTYVRDNIAISLYMTEYDIKMRDQYAISGFYIGQLTFKKYGQNQWKVGNYSVVNVRNVDLMDEVFAR